MAVTQREGKSGIQDAPIEHDIYSRTRAHFAQQPQCANALLFLNGGGGRKERGRVAPAATQLRIKSGSRTETRSEFGCDVAVSAMIVGFDGCTQGLPPAEL